MPITITPVIETVTVLKEVFSVSVLMCTMEMGCVTMAESSNAVYPTRDECMSVSMAKSMEIQMGLEYLGYTVSMSVPNCISKKIPNGEEKVL